MTQLEEARKLYQTANADQKYVLEKLFPELKESEDERIRKDIIVLVNDWWDRVNKDNISTKEQMLAWLEKQGEQKPANKVKPKFKVKYAGSEYNVLEVKDIAGVTYYGIEDEPNHIDYVQAENCERVGGYSIKENGSPYPTKPAKFLGQKSAWSEDDENKINRLIAYFEDKESFTAEDDVVYANWLKSLRPQNHWKPSDEQLDALQYVYRNCNPLPSDKEGWDSIKTLELMYQDLKKLREE